MKSTSANHVAAVLLGAVLLAGCSLGQAREQGLFVNGQALDRPGADAYDAGKAQLLAGNYGVAVHQLRAALRQQPDSPEVLNALGIAYDQLGRTDIAQGYFAQALALDPNSVQTLNNVARSLLRKGSVTLAGTYLKRAALLDPQDSTVSSNLALLAKLQAPHPKSRTATISFRDAAATAWVERASPGVQTLVTRSRDWIAAIPAGEEPPLPLVSFVSLSDIQDRSIDEEPAPLQAASMPVAVSDARPRDPALALTIANGNGRAHMAARTGSFLEARGWRTVRLLNADHFDYARTVITYKPGLAAAAQRLAADLPISAELHESGGADGLLLRIGRDLLPFDRQIAAGENRGQES